MTKSAGPSTTWVNKYNQWHQLGEGRGENRLAQSRNHNFSYMWFKSYGQWVKTSNKTPSEPYIAYCLPLLNSSPHTHFYHKAVDVTVLSSTSLLSAREVYFGRYLEEEPGWSRGSEAEPVLREIRQTGTL